MEDLKAYLLSESVLKLPSGKKGNTFEIYVDSSSLASGGVAYELEKDIEGRVKRYVIGYASKPISEADRKLSSTFLSRTRLHSMSI